MNGTSQKSGMTFIEILAVIVILGVLMGGLAHLARHSRHAADTARARADIAALTDAVERYARVFGEIPTDEELRETGSPESDFDDDSWAVTNLWELWKGECGRPYPFASGSTDDGGRWNWSNELSVAAATDPWGRAYRYRPIARDSGRDGGRDKRDGEDAFEIYSCGPLLLSRETSSDCGSEAYTNDDIFLRL